MRVSKAFYLGSVIGGLAAGILFVVIAVASAVSAGGGMSIDAMMSSAMTGVMLGGLAMLYVAIVVLVLWYKAWASIQDGQARTTPGKAIGFLFIPFFNLYWIFQAMWGFAKDYNSHVQRRGLTVPRLSEGLFLAYVICALASGIPLVGVVVGVVAMVLGLMIVAKLCDAINALATATPRAAAAAGGPLPG